MDPHRSSYPEEQDPRWYGGEQYAEPEWDNSYDGFRVPEPRGERYAPVGRRSGEPLPPDLPPRGQMPPGPPMAPPTGPGYPGGPGPGPGPGPGGGGPGQFAGGPSAAEGPGQFPGGPSPAAGPGQFPGGPSPAAGPGQFPGGPSPAPGQFAGGPGHGAPGTAPGPDGRFPTEALRRASASSDGIYRARRPGTAVLVWTTAAVLALPLLRVLIAGLGSPVSPGAVASSVLLLLALPLGALGGYGLVTGAARVPDATPVHAWLRPPLAYLVVALVLCVAAGLAAG